MGTKQTKEDETPTSPKSPRVSPVDHASGAETSLQQALAALLKQEDSRADEALSPKSDASVKSRPDDADANPHSESAPGRPGRAASQRSLLMALLERVAAKVKA